MNTDYFLFGLEFEFYLKDEDDKTNFINKLNKKLNINLIDLTYVLQHKSTFNLLFPQHCGSQAE